MVPLGLIGNIGMTEMLVILMIGLLLFGSRLPEVGRSLGRGLMEFKKGLKGFQDQVDDVEREADRRVDEELRRQEQQRLAGPAKSPVPEEPLPPQAEARPETPGPGSGTQPRQDP